MPPDSLTDAWHCGYDEIYLVRLAMAAKQFFRRRRHPRIWPASLCVVVLLPLTFNLLMILYRPAWAIRSLEACTWLLVFGVIDAMCVVAAYVAWRYADSQIDQIDSAIGCVQGRLEASRWLRTWLSHRRQIVPPLVSVPVGLFYVYATRPKIGTVVEIGPASYLSVAITCAFGANALYWLWIVPGLAKQLYITGYRGVRWYDPAGTPGIRHLSNGTALTAVLLLAETVIVSVGMLLLPRDDAMAPIRLLVAGYFVAVAASSMRVGVVPIYWIHRTITEAKRATLLRLSGDIPGQIGAKGLRPKAGHSLDLYHRVAATPNLPFTTSAIVQFGATFVGAIIAFITGLVLQ